jgi:hypothetical protein
MPNTSVLTSEPVQAGQFAGLRQEWGRTDDVQRVFGIKRGTLYNLHSDRQINGKVLRVRGQLKGVRLWDMDSIRRYVESQPDDFDSNEQKTPPEGQGDSKTNAVLLSTF